MASVGVTASGPTVTSGASDSPNTATITVDMASVTEAMMMQFMNTPSCSARNTRRPVEARPGP